MSSLSVNSLAALAATAEVCGAQLSPAAAALMAQDLEAYPELALLAALQRCRREVTSRLSLAAIIDRIDDGRPTADEAWAQVGTEDERRTIVSTDEAMQALGEVHQLLVDDPVAARMAFKDGYKRIVTEARTNGSVPVWFGSLGHDRAGRVAPIMQAVERGRLSADHAQDLLGHQMPQRALPIGATVDQLGQQRVSKLLAGLVASTALPGDDLPEYKPPTRDEVDQIRRLQQEAVKATA